MRVFKNLILFGLSFALTMLAVDVFLQSAEIYTPMKSEIDPEIGPTFARGAKVARFNEGFYLGRINDQRYAGPSVPQKAEDGERRILLLGDSYVLGMQVFERDHFGTLMREQLNETQPGRTEVLNFGQGDFNLSNAYVYYHDFASRWDHDLALFFVSNQDLLLARPVNTGLYPTCYMDGDSLRIEYSFRETKRYRRYKQAEPFAQRSALLRMALNMQRVVLRGDRKGLLLGKFAQLLPTRPERNPNLERRPDSEISTPITRGILTELAANPKAVIVLRAKIPPESRAMLEEYGIPIWDLNPTLEQLEESGHDPFYWPVTRERGHWNQLAHEKIADYLAEQVRQLDQP